VRDLLAHVVESEVAQVLRDDARGAHLAIAELGFSWKSRRHATTRELTRSAASRMAASKAKGVSGAFIRQFYAAYL
jgi:hypothetical protein